MKRKEMNNIIGDEEIAKIREKCYENLEAQVSLPITRALNHLSGFAFKNALIPNVPAITVSVDTFYILIEPFTGSADEAYRLKGKEAGRLFAKRYLDFLRFEVGVPKSIQHLLKGWVFFDTGANWGTFDAFYEEEQRRIIVTLKDSFLTRNRVKDKHRFCSFMVGYIEGLLWTCLKYWPRWFRDVATVNPFNLVPDNIKEYPEGDVCRFIVSLTTEEFADAFDGLYLIERLIQQGDLRRIPLEIRTVLELALKKKLGIKHEERIYVPQLLIPFKTLKNDKIDISRISHVYGWASQDAHLSAEYPKEDILNNFGIISDFLRELELLEIDDDKQTLLRAKALEARAGSGHRKVKGIFFSYSHQDKAFVDKLANDLQNSGISIWIDKAELKLGDSLIKKISEGIDKMEYLAVVLSPNSVNSSWVEKELEIAMSQEIQGKRIKVLPLLYEECAIPNFLQGKFYADFSKKETYEIAVELILDRLR